MQEKRRTRRLISCNWLNFGCLPLGVLRENRGTGIEPANCLFAEINQTIFSGSTFVLYLLYRLSYSPTKDTLLSFYCRPRAPQRYL